MPPKSQEAKIRAEIEEYVAPVLASPTTDDRPLSVLAVSKLYGRSRQTYYRYGLEKRLQAVADFREGHRAQRSPVRGDEERLERARVDAAHWEMMYRGVLGKLTILENFFLRHATIDVDVVYRRGIPKPDRQDPS